MTPKDWNTQEEAIDAAKAEILAAIGDTDARLELGMVKSIQKGVGRFYRDVSNPTELRITINTVDPNKTMVLLDSSTRDDGNISVYLYAVNTDSLDFRIVQSTSQGISFSWQAVEFY